MRYWLKYVSVCVWVCGSSFVCPRGEYPHQICAKSRNKSKLRENLLNSNLMDIRRRLSIRCGRSLLLLEQITSTSISTRIHFLEVKNCFEHTKAKFSNQNRTDIQKMRKFISKHPKIFCYRKFYRKLQRKVKWLPNGEQTGKRKERPIWWNSISPWAPWLIDKYRYYKKNVLLCMAVNSSLGPQKKNEILLFFIKTQFIERFLPKTCQSFR